MQPREDQFRLQDILGCLERIERYTAGIESLTELEANELVTDAVVRNLISIGEAVAYHSEEVCNAAPETPWRSIRAMRNLIVHRYWRQDAAEVWAVLNKDLAPLKAAVTALLERMPPGGPRGGTPSAG